MMDSYSPVHRSENKELWSLLKVITHVGNSKTDINSQPLVAETVPPSPGCLPGMGIVWTTVLMGCGSSTLRVGPLLRSLPPWDMARGLNTASLLPDRKCDSSLASAFFTWEAGFCVMQSRLSSDALTAESPWCQPVHLAAAPFPGRSETSISGSIHLVFDGPHGCLWLLVPETILSTCPVPLTSKDVPAPHL